MVTLAQVNFFILTDTFNMCHPSYESMSGRWYPVEHVLIVAARTEPALSRPSPLRSRSEEQIS
ncbi:MAG TPA: hypothetical protein VEL31_14810 [Ktedonobacteraceae bacterium]|nr:hypothetical protein [Ktedonobacteraceae bacterium]